MLLCCDMLCACLCVSVCVWLCVSCACEPQAQATYGPKKQVTYNCQTRFSYLCTTPWSSSATFFFLRMQCLRSLCRLMGKLGKQFLANSLIPFQKIGTENWSLCNQWTNIWSNCLLIPTFLLKKMQPLQAKDKHTLLSGSLCRLVGF